ALITGDGMLEITQSSISDTLSRKEFIACRGWPPIYVGGHCSPGVSRTVKVRAKASVMLEPYSQESICTKGVRAYFGFAMSRYLKNGSPGECRYCGRPLEGCAIRERETNRYYCSDDCLEGDKIEAFRVLAALRHQMLALVTLN